MSILFRGIVITARRRKNEDIQNLSSEEWGMVERKCENT